MSDKLQQFVAGSIVTDEVINLRSLAVMTSLRCRFLV